MHVPLAPARVGEDFTRGRMLHQKILQPFTERTALRPPNPALVVHHADAHVAALERNAPRPPAVAGEMIGRRGSNAMTDHRPLREFFSQLEPIPVLHVRPARPY